MLCRKIAAELFDLPDGDGEGDRVPDQQTQHRRHTGVDQRVEIGAEIAGDQPWTDVITGVSQ